MPTVLRSGAYRFFFYSGEGREPAHVHVEAGDQYAKFWLHPVQLASSVGLRAHELNELRKLVERRATEIEEKWNEFFSRR